MKLRIALFALLAVLLVVAGVIYVPRLTTQAKVNNLQDRFAVSSALKRAVTRVQRTEKRWPKGIDELRDAPELAEVKGQLTGVKYDFVRLDGDNGVYHFEMGPISSEVKIAKYKPSTGVPTLGTPSQAGG